MPLLDMLQRATQRLGIAKPASIIGNSDIQVGQLLEIANTEGEDLSARYQWSAKKRSNVFNLVLATSQGKMNGAVVDDAGFDYIIPETFWNRTISLPIRPMDSIAYQQIKSFPFTGPYQRFQIRGGNLLFIEPTPTTTDECAFDYITKSWCESASGTAQKLWTADGDVGLLDEDLMRLGIIWRWRHAKGLEYAQDFENYEARVLDAMARDGAKETRDIGGESQQPEAGIIIPIGSWDL